MRNTNYITIQGWMINELQLKGSELIVFAIIYGFSQDGVSEFTGSINYIKDTLRCSRNTVIKTTKRLVDLEFISKKQVSISGVTYNKYSVTEKALNVGSAKNELGVVQKLDLGSAKIAPNNTIYNTNNNKPSKKKKLNIVREDYLQRYLDMFNGLKEKFVGQKSSKTVNNKKIVESWNDFMETIKDESDVESVYIPDIRKAIEASCKSDWHKENKYKHITPEFFLRADKREYWLDIYNSEHAEVVDNKKYNVKGMMHYSIQEETKNQ